MKKTSNYQLNQWDPDDKVQRTDFNADNAKIDAALKVNADAIAAETSARISAVQSEANARAEAVRAEASARDSAVTAVSAKVPKIAAGTYTGNGAASRTISLGFTPKAVLVTSANGWMRYNYSSSSYYTYGGLAVTGAPAMDSRGQAIVTIRSGGFQVADGTWTDSAHVNHYTYGNQNGQAYHYLAIG